MDDIYTSDPTWRRENPDYDPNDYKTDEDVSDEPDGTNGNDDDDYYEIEEESEESDSEEADCDDEETEDSDRAIADEF